jgi:hypothetical protein
LVFSFIKNNASGVTIAFPGDWFALVISLSSVSGS